MDNEIEYNFDVDYWFSSLKTLNSECQNYTVTEMRYQELLKEHDSKIRSKAIDELVEKFVLEDSILILDHYYDVLRECAENLKNQK